MDRKAVWERYVASWKPQAAQQKRALFETCLAPECTYSDPLQVAHGWEALLEYMLEFQKQVPGGYFVTEYFATHHQKSIAKWRMLSADAAQIGEGMSYGEYDANGLLVAMTGFFEPPAS
ncbi:MAG TPA: nuclear transport factor 2 family protein [Polyangiaceae bacterium]|nr:nuclear transport factor 2 family protein [Polyangiaceae bacterium]